MGREIKGETNTVFNKDLINYLKEENKRLRDENTKLLDQIIVLSGKASEHMAMQEANQPFEPSTYLDYATGEIKKMPAETPEEIEQKAEAIREAEEMFQTAGVI
jgi:hypothetical protein